MFSRKVTVTESGKKHVYIEIFDCDPNCADKARPIARLGPVNRPTGKVDVLVRDLSEFCRKKLISTEEISAERIWSWGPILLTRHFWDEIGLAKIISAACGRRAADAAFALTANRLVDPCYEYGMDNWLEKVFLPAGLSYLRDTSARNKGPGGSGTPRDNLWDNSVRKLAARRRVIEKALADTVKQTCGSCDEVVLYQLDTTFVERMTPRRDFVKWPAQRSQRNTRLHLGTIVCDGWPLALRFFGSSEPNVLQIRRFIEESQRRFGFRKVLFVAPAGTDEEKLRQLESLGFHYLVGVRRRRDPRAVEVIQQAGRQWVKIGPDTRVQEVLLPADTDASLEPLTPDQMVTERYFLVHSAQDAKEERALRASVVSRALKALEEIKRAVEDGRLKRPATIMARAERILAGRKAYRYISWRITPQGQFEFRQDRRKSAVRRAYEGISLLRTSDAGLSPSSAVLVYEGLRRHENAFNMISDTAASRATPLPLPHIEEHSNNGKPANLFVGHLLISQLALLLRCRLEKRLLEKKMALSLEDALSPIETISLAELRVGGEKKLVVSPGNRTARKIIRALGILNLNPTPDASRDDARTSPK